MQSTRTRYTYGRTRGQTAQHCGPQDAWNMQQATHAPSDSKCGEMLHSSLGGRAKRGPVGHRHQRDDMSTSTCMQHVNIRYACIAPLLVERSAPPLIIVIAACCEPGSRTCWGASVQLVGCHKLTETGSWVFLTTKNNAPAFALGGSSCRLPL